MKFYGITMEGKFINQNVAQTVVNTFNPATDVGRLVYNDDDGYLWWGDGEIGRWRSLGEGGGDASEEEDMYSDLLRTSVFLNCTYDEFASIVGTDPLLDAGESSGTLANMYNNDTDAYDITSSGITVVSTNLFDGHVSGSVPNIPYCMASVDWLDAHPHSSPPNVWVSNDGGSTWEVGANNQVHKFNSTGTDLRIKAVTTGAGTLYSWGILYNKDLSVSCGKQALTVVSITYPDALETTYIPGAILVYLNGILLDSSDYTATDGTTITIDSPTLQNGDIVTIISMGTSVLATEIPDGNDFIRKDGTAAWNGGVSQSVNNGKFTGIADGSAGTQDSVNARQLLETYTGALATHVNRHAKLYTNQTIAGADIVCDASTGNLSLNSNNITNLGDGTGAGEAVHYGQFGSLQANDGYQVLPSGLIFKWGQVVIPAGSPIPLTPFAILFDPTVPFSNVFNLQVTCENPASLVEDLYAVIDTYTLIGGSVTISSSTPPFVTAAPGVLHWFAIGN